MLHAVPTSWLSSKFRIEDGGRDVGQLDLAAIRERATFTVKDVEFALYREGLVSGDFVLDFHGSAIAVAQKPSAFRQRFTLSFDERHYTLEAASVMGRTFVLREGDVEAGRVSPVDWFSRKAEIDLPESVPLPIQVFCFWLVLILWKRAAAAASG
ncbi:MAG: hypothetical protein ABJF88_10770 [Rhodothermales bacterium]